MTNINRQIANLSAEKRRLLELLLQEEGVALAPPPITVRPRTTNRFPLSFAQRRLWFLHQLEPSSPLYNLPVAIRLRGRLDVAALHRTLDAVVRRHEILRTTFHEENGDAVQVIAPEQPVDLRVVEFTNGSGRDQAAIQRQIDDEARRPFDLSAGPLLRVLLLRVNTTEHILLLTLHHIVCDGWSAGLLVHEVGTLYNAFAAGKPSPLPAPPLQYVDFALWQHEWLRGPVLDRLLTYWKGQLAGVTPELPLPTGQSCSEIESDRSATHHFRWPASLVQAVRRLARRHETTLFTTLLTAFQTLLHRYSGQDEICVGSPVANRNQVGAETLMGFFVNMLVLRGDLAGAPSFAELVARNRQMTTDAVEHQDLPFEKLVEALQPERNRSHMPFFQVIFDLNNNPSRPLALHDLEAEILPVSTGVAHADLVLNLYEEDDEIRGKLEYNFGLFDAATIDRLMAHYQRILEEVTAAPETPISEIPLLSADERRQLVDEWNQATLSFPADRTLHGWFEQQAAQTPAAVAVTCGDDRLTYAELNARANQLAHCLRKQGVRPESTVALYLDRSVDMLVAILGVLKAGGAYVPLDPAYPQERLAFMLADSAAALVLSQADMRNHLPEQAAPVFCVDSDWDDIAGEDTANPSSLVTPDVAAYIIYTSGSTGKPKGVLVTHYNVTRLMQATHDWFHFGEDDVWTLFHSYAFDFSVWEIWGALLYGGRLVVVPYWLSRSPDAFYQLLVDEGVTVLNQTPSAFRQLIAAEDRVGQQPLALRCVIFGGEALALPSLAPWFARHGDTSPQLVNMYGITETTVHVTYRPISAEDVAAARGSVIGRAIPDLRLYILDANRQPVPLGAPGELYVGGAGVARGYRNRADLTRERFLPDPFHPGQRLYRTGDLARYLPNPNGQPDIEYLGRLDDQVKIRGFRIELGEIESALTRHPGVREATVLVHERSAEDKRLVAYWVPDASEPDTAELRSWLGRHLPDYMTPAAFVRMDALPLTPNGKLDRRALPAPETDRPDLTDGYVAPATPTEERLAAIWAEVLGLAQVGVHDNFFQLGGHSLLATRLMSRIRDGFGLEMPLAALFESPTVADLARRLDAASQSAASQQTEPALQPVPRDGHLPLAFSQQRLWFLEQLEPGNPAYCIPAAVRLTGPLNVDALRRAVDEIVRRHESLRTSIAVIDGEPVQQIEPSLRLEIPIHDLRDLPVHAREDAAMQTVLREAQRSFDLRRAPLLRLRLLRLEDDEHIAAVTMHHIISDAWSIGIFVDELAQLYAAFAQGQPSPLPELTLQYGDFAYWQQQWLQGDVLAAHLDYWQRQLANLPLLRLPTDKLRPPVQTFNGDWETVTLSAELTQALTELSRRHGATQFMTLLAAFKTLLHRYTGQEDIVVGADIANRNRRQTEGIIGFFVNQLVLRSDLSGNPSFAALLERVREMALAAFAHQDLPFHRLVEALQPKRDPSRNPLFQVMFIVQNAPMPTLELSGVTLIPIPIDQETSVFDLSIFFTETAAGETEVRCRYNTDLFEGATIARMLVHLQTLLASVVAQPEARLSMLEMLTESETKEKVVEKVKRKQSKFDKLLKTKAQTVNLSQEELVQRSYLQPGQTLPLVIQPNVDGVDLIDWAGTQRDFVEEQLLQHGAILFRGFDVPTIERFETFTRALAPDLMEYGERSSPRHKVSGNIYTSTDHPADQSIVLHNEQSYTLNWMMKLWFYCAQPATQGGSTPIASSRNIYQRLSPATVDKFAQKQVMYLRNYGVGMGLPWQEVFRTEDKAAVEAYCQDHAIDYEWLDDNRLRTRQVRPAIRRHPKTGEPVWFNHALFFHVSSLEEATRESLLAGLGEEDLPFNTYYGDGTPFEPEVLDEVRNAFTAETLAFPWQQGDILMLDNMLVAHGRDPYQGQRKVVVAMAEPYQSVGIGD